MKKALILGVFENTDEKCGYELTTSSQRFNEHVNGNLRKVIDVVGVVTNGKNRIFYELSDEYTVVCAVGLGPKNAGYNEMEEIYENRENVRRGVACGLRAVRDLFNETVAIDVDDCHDAEAAAEGSFLSAFYFDELKCEKFKKHAVTLSLFNPTNNAEVARKWQNGEVLAKGQNICRRLMELPSNHCTPTMFAQMAHELAVQHSIKVEIRNKSWIEAQKMGCFLSVSQGSGELPVFLEMHYNNAPNTKPIILVGKGITFDTGGISLKRSLTMSDMRADMGGAANVVATIVTLASLKAPVNVSVLVPLTENMPGSKATKPGDVFTAMNGKTVQVNNTDAEGRLVLADALCYAHRFEPELIVDVATLTGSIRIALGAGAAGVFSTSNYYWELLRKSGSHTGDRVWRLPLFNSYTKQVANTQLADLNNVGKCSPAAGACVAAAFLKEFVTCANWMHLDIAGVRPNNDEVSYLSKGMAGRPLRTLVGFVQSVFDHKK